jgi:hypothetical protein
VRGLGVALVRGPEKLASSSTDDRGDVFLAMPPWQSGAFDLVVGAGIVDYPLVSRGEFLGRVVVKPDAAP